MCCSDKVHCCPEDYTCDIGTGTCSKGKDRMTWFSKMPVKQVPALKAVTCPDGSSCDDRQTCCEDQQGGYACCPIPKVIYTYSPTRLGRTWIPQNHIFLEHILFPLLNSSLFLLKMYPFVEIFGRFNTDSSNFLPLFTNKKPESIENKANHESLDRNLIFASL